MVFYHRDIIHKAIDSLSGNIGESGRRIVFINGNFGTGKTFIVDEIIKFLVADEVFDDIFKYSATPDVKFLPEFANAIFRESVGSNRENEVFHAMETKYNLVRFNNIITTIREYDPKLFTYIISNYSLLNKFDFHWKKKQNSPVNADMIFKIREIIKSKDDQILLEKPGRMCAESVVVDLITSYLPINDKLLFDDYMQSGKKKSIAIIIDGYDGFSGSVDDWLAEDFIPACTDMKLSKFIHFENPTVASDLQVNHIFDIRFVLSGRFSFCREGNAVLNKHKDDSILLSLKEVDSENILQYLLAEELSPEEYHWDFESIAGGNLYIMSILTESIKIGSINFDMFRIYQLVEEKIFIGHTEQQRDWIRCAAFLDEFDIWGLRCFPSMTENYNEAYDFFLNSENLACQIQNSNKITLHLQVKEFVRGSIKVLSESLFKEYCKIRDKYHSFSELLEKYDTNECDILRNIAYLNRFDIDFTIRKAFLYESENAIKIINKHSKLFDKKEFIYRMKSDIASEFLEFNKVIDNIRFDEKLETIKEINILNKENIENKRLKKKAKIESIKSQINKSHDESDDGKTLFDDVQNEYIEVENRLIEQRKKKDDFSQKNNQKPVITLSAASAIFIILSIFAEVIFEGFFKHDTTINLVRKILITMSGITIISGVYYYMKGTVSGRGKIEYEESLIEIDELKKLKKELFADLEKIKSNFEVADKSIEELSSIIDSLINEIKSLDKKEKELNI